MTRSGGAATSVTVEERQRATVTFDAAGSSDAATATSVLAEERQRAAATFDAAGTSDAATAPDATAWSPPWWGGTS